MVTTGPAHLVRDFLGSAQIFTSAINDLLEQQLHVVTGKKLTFSQLKLLKMVSLTEGYTISNVAAFLGVSNAAASRAVDRLVRRDLIRRTEAEADRRAVRLSLTEAGHHLLASYDAASDRALQALFERFSSDQLRTAADLLDNISLGSGIHFRERCLLRQTARHDCHFHLHKKQGPKETRTGAPPSGEAG
jgi:DNA-binding MarR family transcriptional regulator